jgi:hypothetical protein
MSRPERDISAVLETLDVAEWGGPVRTNMADTAMTALEDGKVLYFPRLAFTLSTEERRFLDPAVADAKAKNVSFDPATGKLKHATAPAADLTAIRAMLQRYCEQTTALLRVLLPQYTEAIETGRTSFRPAEISGRALSDRKDDTRLHVDAFPSTPMGGKRILRIFTNVNSDGVARQWRLGAPFGDVAAAFAHRRPRRSTVAAKLLSVIGATKSQRTAYDDEMLALHDTMKMDDAYQRDAVQNTFNFPPGSTWVVFTDQVSHAAMGGQHVFEQTFYLQVSAMADPAKSPLRTLERMRSRALV